jgi:hypothetical protein
MDQNRDGPGVQGEGDYASAKRYDDDAKRFAESGRVEEAAERARTDDPAELADNERAEAAGRARAKEEDPLLRPDAPPQERPGAQGGDAQRAPGGPDVGDRPGGGGERG